MKNKERYANEIIEAAVKGEHISVDKQSGKILSCIEADCEKCLFFRADPATLTCRGMFSSWVNSEYKEKREFSETDKALVKGLDKLNWFARDRDGAVYGYVDKPFKDVCLWDVKPGADGNYALDRVSSYTSATFEPLSWEDEEPTHRDEILGVK